VAQSKRRNRNVEENLDEVIDESVDTDALDEADATVDDDADVDELDDADVDESDTDLEDEDAEAPATDRKAGKAKVKDKKAVKVDLEESGPGIFGRFGRFVLEVVAELRKVIWPTRKDLLVYTTVVVVFVAIMLTIVGGLDWAFARAVLWVFSGN
jgi:preprotein translocase subunit SecE